MTNDKKRKEIVVRETVVTVAEILDLLEMDHDKTDVHVGEWVRLYPSTEITFIQREEA